MLQKIATFKILLLILILIGIYSMGRLLVFHQLKKVLEKGLADLREQGIAIQMTRLHVGPWRNEIQMDSVRVQFQNAAGKDAQVLARAGTITLRGIALYKVIFNQELWVRSVHLTQPFIQTLDKPTDQPPSKPVKKRQTPALQRFFIRHVQIDQGRWRINDNAATPVRITTLDQVNLSDFCILNTTKHSLQWQVGQTQASAVKIDFPKNLYTLQVKAFFYNTAAKKLTIDTVQLIPHYNKTEFARKAAQQIARLEATIPYLEVEGCTLESAPEFTVQAQRMKLRLHLLSYVDKRYPFKNAADRVLPVRFLQELPLRVQIDTLRLENSYALHEEMPETGGATGAVFFEKLNATITNINNAVKNEPAPAPTLSVTALFMGQGDLRAEFRFPHQPDEPYDVNGVMYHFPMTKMNEVIEPLAHTRIESGDMQWIKFNFRYNDNQADGEVEMHYKNLKIIAFKKDNPQKKAGFKNFLLNTFILKEDMDETMKKEDRMGTIHFYRDRRRSLFHYWWKSILSGVLSAYNIDKVPTPKK